MEEEEPPPMRRLFGRSSMPKLKRSSKTFLGRFRKVSAPNKQEAKTKKSLKVKKKMFSIVKTILKIVQQ